LRECWRIFLESLPGAGGIVETSGGVGETYLGAPVGQRVPETMLGDREIIVGSEIVLNSNSELHADNPNGTRLAVLLRARDERCWSSA